MAYRKDWAAEPQVAADGFVGAVKMPGRRVSLTVSDLSTAGNTIGAFTVPAGFVVTGCIVVYSAMDAGAFIQASATTVAEDASIATVIAGLTVVGGSAGPYTFTETADPDNKFTVTGTNLLSSAAFNYEAATSHSVTITADDGIEPVVTTIVITVTNVFETTLATLTLDTSTIDEGSAAPTLVGTLQGVTAGSSLSMTDTAGGRFALSGSTVVAGATLTDYEVATTHNITVREAHADAAAPVDSIIAITVIDDSAEFTLSALTLDDDELPQNSPEGTDVGGLVGVSPGSTLALVDDDGGHFTLVSTTVKVGAVPLAEGTYSITVRETNPLGLNSPLDTILSIEAVGELAALTLSNAEIDENSSEDDPVGTLQNVTAGSTVTLEDDAGGRFALDGLDILVGATPSDFETAATYNITVRETNAGGYSNSPNDNVITITINDVEDTAPDLTATDVDGITDTTATAQVTTNMSSGTLYMVVTQSATDPSKAQVKLGQNDASAAADFADDQAIASSGEKSFSVTGLDAETTYYAYFMHENFYGQSDVVSFDGWETSSATAPGPGTLAWTDNGGGRTPTFLLTLGASGAGVGDVPKIYIAGVSDTSYTIYITGAALDSGNISDGYVDLDGVTLLDDNSYQAHARIHDGVLEGDLSNEVEFNIATAPVLEAGFSTFEVDYNEGFTFLITGDIQEADEIYIQASKSDVFSSIEDTAQATWTSGVLVEDTPFDPLTNGMTYFRCHRVRVGADDSDHSNIVSTTINVTGAQSTFFGNRYFGPRYFGDRYAA